MAVLLLSSYLIYHQGSDVIYALSGGSTPKNLGAAAALFRQGAPPLPANRYVRIDGTPDFESAVVLDTQGEWKFRSFFRLLNTQGKLFVERMPGPLPSAAAERSSFAGRLLPLNNVSFSQSIRDYYAAHVAATHVFVPTAFRAALTAKQVPGALPDRLGAQVSLAGNDVLTFDVRTPEHFVVELPQTHFSQQAAALQAVTKTGAKPKDQGRVVPRERGASGFAFEIQVPPAEERQVLSALADLAGRVRIEPVVRSVSARLNDLADGGESLSLRELPTTQEGKPAASEAQSVPWGQVVGVRTAANLKIPDDAFLLLEGERPSSHYRAVVATAFLLAFALINLLAFRRRV